MEVNTDRALSVEKISDQDRASNRSDKRGTLIKAAPDKIEPLNEEIRKLSEPNCLTRLMVDRPCLLISISYILMIGVSVFVF